MTKLYFNHLVTGPYLAQKNKKCRGRETVSELKHPNEINRDYIRLLQAMCRFVREEFSVSIRMTQEDAIDLLLHFAGQSSNNMLQEMGKELREFAYVPVTPEAAIAEELKGAEAVRYYRGAPVAGADDNGNASEKTKAEEPLKEKTKPTRVYRGRVVNV